MNASKNQGLKHIGFWAILWLLQSALFSRGQDFQFYLVKNIAIVGLQAVVVYSNFFFSSSLLFRKKYAAYVVLSASLVYVVFSISFDFIGMIISLFFPSIFRVSGGSSTWWPTEFWQILSGSAPYSIALLSSTIFYLVTAHKDKISTGDFDNQELENGDDGIILIKEGKTLHRINTADVLYVEGLKEYVNWHIGGKKLITLHSLQKLEDLLGSKGFLRTHKSFIINTNCVDTIKSTSVEISGKKIPIGRSYRQKVQQHFNFK